MAISTTIKNFAGTLFQQAGNRLVDEPATVHQAGRGRQPYLKGLESIADRRWGDAVDHLTRARALGYRAGRTNYHLAFARFYKEAGDVSCNFCNGTRFRDRNNRPNVVCTSCGSLERTRYLRLYIETLGITSSHRILHIAPDSGLVEWLHGICGDNYVCADISEARYSHLPNYVQLDLCKEDWPVEDRQFDIIIHSHVLEHLPCNYSVVLKRLNSMLSDNGRQLVLIPIFAGHYAEDLRPLSKAVRAENRQRFHQGNHVRLFGRADMDRTFGALFDFEPYKSYDMRSFVSDKMLTQHNIPSPFWTGLTLSTVFDISKKSFRM